LQKDCYFEENNVPQKTESIENMTKE